MKSDFAIVTSIGNVFLEGSLGSKMDVKSVVAKSPQLSMASRFVIVAKEKRRSTAADDEPIAINLTYPSGHPYPTNASVQFKFGDGKTEKWDLEERDGSIDLYVTHQFRTPGNFSISAKISNIVSSQTLTTEVELAKKITGLKVKALHGTPAIPGFGKLQDRFPLDQEVKFNLRVASERAGRMSTSTTDEKINEVEKMILTNRRITVREVAEDLNISIGSCHSIFINDLGIRRVAAKFVPKLLNCDQKQHHMNIANEMLDSVRDDPNLLQRVITGDEAWVYGYDVETKVQSSQWKLPHEPRPKKARQVRSNVKVLLTVFFDCRGVVHHEFLPQGRMVNKEYYLQVMRNLREAIRQKRPDLWKNKNWLLHHDNAPAHTSLLVCDFLAKNNTLMMPQPPYSPDLAPCDFFLFPKLKRPMKGRRYEMKTASKEELKKILKNDFLKCFEDWKKPLAQVWPLSAWCRLYLYDQKFGPRGFLRNQEMGQVELFTAQLADGTLIKNDSENSFGYKFHDVGYHNVSVFAYNHVQHFTDPAVIQLYLMQPVKGLLVEEHFNVTENDEERYFEITYEDVGTDSCMVINYGDGQMPEASGLESTCFTNYSRDDVVYTGKLNDTIFFMHLYPRQGNYTLSVTTFNDVSKSVFNHTFTVPDLSCKPPELAIRNRILDPLEAPEIFRSIPIVQYASAEVRCNATLEAIRSWEIIELEEETAKFKEKVDLSEVDSARKTMLFIRPLFLQKGIYKFRFKVKMLASRPFSCFFLEHAQSLHPLLTSTQQLYCRIMSSQKRKRESITIEKKKEICQLARNNPTMSKNEIGKRFSLPRTTVRDILTQAEKWENYTRFKGRFHISQRRLCGEGASISPAIIDEHLTNLNSILANSGYDPANIYNADETGLFFQLIPDRTLAHKDENCRGVKRMKQRITVLLCCNSTGTDKRRLLIIGKSAKPRCFRNFSPHFYCTYTSNSKAWMTSSIFQEWLLEFNKQLVSEGRRILLFFKAQYRKLQLQKMVELADAHLPTELRLDYAVRYCKMAWDSVSPDSTSNCWNHTGIIRFTSTAAVEPLNYGNLLDRIRNIFAITPENLMTEREFQLVDDSQEAEKKLTDDNFLVSTVTAKEELGEDDDATVTQRLPSLREARTAAETVLLFLEHSKRATSDDVNLSADLLRRVYAISPPGHPMFPFHRSMDTYVAVIPSPVKVQMSDGAQSRITRGLGQFLRLNPRNYSVDPDDPDNKVWTFFNWICVRVERLHLAMGNHSLEGLRQEKIIHVFLQAISHRRLLIEHWIWCGCPILLSLLNLYIKIHFKTSRNVQDLVWISYIDLFAEYLHQDTLQEMFKIYIALFAEYLHQDTLQEMFKIWWMSYIALFAESLHQDTLQDFKKCSRSGGCPILLSLLNLYIKIHFKTSRNVQDLVWISYIALFAEYLHQDILQEMFKIWWMSYIALFAESLHQDTLQDFKKCSRAGGSHILISLLNLYIKIHFKTSINVQDLILKTSRNVQDLVWISYIDLFAEYLHQDTLQEMFKIWWMSYIALFAESLHQDTLQDFKKCSRSGGSHILISLLNLYIKIHFKTSRNVQDLVNLLYCSLC
ncbi:hypothetical protein LAZ67_2002885 [Cordylochernes scorpioides]|uniref:PKD domain-containing protein n=1 Tax=Cordylochernes scorpioides TaxID=51811 RepID=A0ABY6K2C0_9ARAC|nr:hypothetical protein LAZ67_2002885 [Cordylochernes scorpioides]